MNITVRNIVLLLLTMIILFFVNMKYNLGVGFLIFVAFFTIFISFIYNLISNNKRYKNEK